jgi:hypothetical protein
MFDLHHPVGRGQSPVNRQTALGGVFTVLNIILIIIIFSFLVNRFFGKIHFIHTISVGSLY